MVRLQRRIADGRPWLAAAVAALAAILFTRPQPAAADIFHFKDGTKVEGEELERNVTHVRVRVRHGEVMVSLDKVARIEAAMSPWALYEHLRKRYPDTADGHYQLGLWCREHELGDEAAAEFAKAVQLDPNHAAARKALGHTRIGDVWLEPGKEPSALAGPVEKPPANPAAAASQPADPEQARVNMRAAEKEMLDALRVEWLKRVRWLRGNYLDSGSRAVFNQGAEQLMAIRDPLAVEAMVQVLGDGAVEQRRLLARTLGRFDTSASTLALLEFCLLDDDDEVRRQALRSLDGRSDPRMQAYLVRALSSREDHVVRNAARALGALRMSQAVPDLVAVLTGAQSQRVPVENVVRSMRTRFLDGRLRSQIVSPMFRTPQTQTMTVTVFRTEVQEALIAITGENYGFDGEQWMQWYRRNVEQPRLATPSETLPSLPPETGGTGR